MEIISARKQPWCASNATQKAQQIDSVYENGVARETNYATTQRYAVNDLMSTLQDFLAGYKTTDAISWNSAITYEQGSLIIVDTGSNFLHYCSETDGNKGNDPALGSPWNLYATIPY